MQAGQLKSAAFADEMRTRREYDAQIASHPSRSRSSFSGSDSTRAGSSSGTSWTNLGLRGVPSSDLRREGSSRIDQFEIDGEYKFNTSERCPKASTEE